MIREGDRIAVGVSGGKDSLALAHALSLLSRRSPVKFSLQAFTIEQGKFVRPVEPVGEALEERGIPWTYYRDEPSFQLLTEQPSHGCDTCSRFRRRAVYDVASKLGCNVVALGHTADDLCEALLRNALFTGRLSALPPVTWSRSGDFRLIRPLVYVFEEVTRAYAEAAGMPVTPCVCSFKSGTVREKLRGFLADLRRDNPHVLENLLASMGRIDSARLLDTRFLPSRPASEDARQDIINVVLKRPASSPGARQVPLATHGSKSCRLLGEKSGERANPRCRVHAFPVRLGCRFQADSARGLTRER